MPGWNIAFELAGNIAFELAAAQMWLLGFECVDAEQLISKQWYIRGYYSFLICFGWSYEPL